ncbi:MAG: PD40 domain-containing protein [Chloroflexi bacterium]|nr:PD40 domain-containing protein [Chloroflexota bacterium]
MRGNIYAVRPDGSELQRLLGPDNESYSAPEFSPDGQQLAYIVNRNRVVVVDASDASNILSDIDLFLDRTPPTPIASDFSMGPVAVYWSPDGTMLLVTRQRLGGSGASDVLVMNVSGTELRVVLDAGVFIEATWWREPDGTPRILVVGADASRNAITYDLDGAVVGRGLPATATRSAVASLQHPDDDSVLIRSTLGSPGPFEPIEVEDAGGPRIVAGGCGATWSPDGERFAFYNGEGIALKSPDAPLDDVDLIVTNADLDIIDDASGPREDVCFGLGISWSADAAIGIAATPELSSSPTAETSFYRDEDLGIEFAIPGSWEDGAAGMPYASCFGCLIMGPREGSSPPYGIAIYNTIMDFSGPECGNQFGGCTVIGAFGIRTLRDGEETMLTVAGLPAAQQRMFRQPPVGVTNMTGEVRNYRDIATVIDTPIGNDLIVLGFYREDDGVGKLEVEIAYNVLLTSLVIEEEHGLTTTPAVVV